MSAINPDERIISVAKVPPEAAQLCMIGDIIIDAALHEEHDSEFEVTEYPVEKGSDITDNIRAKPRTVTLECVVSNTPINPHVIAARAGVSDSDGAPADDVYVRLLGIRDNREPVDIQTSLESYTSMALQSLSIPRSAAQGDALFFTAKFVEVQIVENTRTTRVAIPAAKGPKTITKAPVPVASTGKSFNDSLPQYKVIRAFEAIHGEDYYWFDDAIQGWRLQAVHDAPIGGDTAAEGWVVFKDRPFGANTGEWQSHYQDDAYWQTKIASESGNDRGTNPFDPFGGNLGQGSGNVTDIRVVHAMRR